MDYVKIYDSLIERARNRKLTCFVEKHHVVPRCLGGSNKPSNRVELTPEEHYVAHQLLIKIHPRNHKLIYATNMMTADRPGNKLYGWIRKKLSAARSGKLNPNFGVRFRWITDGKTNKRFRSSGNPPNGWEFGTSFRLSPAHLARLAIGRKGRPLSLKHRSNLSKSGRIGWNKRRSNGS